MERRDDASRWRERERERWRGERRAAETERAPSALSFIINARKGGASPRTAPRARDDLSRYFCRVGRASACYFWSFWQNGFWTLWRVESASPSEISCA